MPRTFHSSTATASEAVAPASVPPPYDAERYGTEHAAAALLGLSPATLRTWRSRRVGPMCWKKFGRAVRYDLTGVRAWRAAQPGPDSDVPRQAA